MKRNRKKKGKADSKHLLDTELSPNHEARLFRSTLSEWRHEAQVILYGAILICRQGSALLRVNFKEWTLTEGAVITLYPNDVVTLFPNPDDEESLEQFEVEMLKYDPSLLREASLQMEQTVYSSLKEDRCRQDSVVVTNIITNMFSLLNVYFSQSECTCLTQLVLLQLKAFFVGYNEYLMRNPQKRPNEIKSRRVRELFNMFMMLLERDYKISRDVNYYSSKLSITSKYLTNIVRQVTGHTPKSIIDHYVVLQLKNYLRVSPKNVKEISWEYNFSDVSFFCRYFKRHTGISPLQFRQ